MRDQLYLEFHPIKNEDLDLKKLKPHSTKKVWWICKKKHEWKAKITDRTSGTSCPYCSSRKLGYGNDLKTLNPELSKEWHPIKNGILTPDKIFPNTNKKVWWLCEKGHEWKASPNKRHSSCRRCPYCEKRYGQKISIEDSFYFLHPKLLKEWDFSKNKKIKPETISPNSTKKMWWLCEKNHSYKMPLYSKINKSKCPYCCNKKLGYGNDLQSKNPELAKEWHPIKNGKLTPNKTIYGTRRKIWWVCEKGHEWEVDLKLRKKEFGCPFCSGKRPTKENNLKIHNLELTKEWNHKKNKKEPEEFLPYSNKKVWWLCDKEHEWKASISSRNYGWSNCPICYNQVYINQEKCRNIFKHLTNCKFPSLKPEWLVNPKTGFKLELDGYNEKLKLAFEYDGEWHYFNHPSNKNSLKEQIYRDLVKDQICKEKGVTLIRISYKEKDNLKSFILSKIALLNIKIFYP